MSVKDKEYIAYKGTKFTVEWYFDSKGKSSALEYAEALDEDNKSKFAQLVSVLADHGEIRNITKFRYEGDKIYAFKPKPHRFLCFFYSGRKIIITNGFYKDQDKLPQNEKTKALNYKEDYEERVKKNKYY